MTTNQINYWNLQENKRHNVRTEGQTDVQLAETERHNRATEGIDISKLSEQSRHNLETERQGRESLGIDHGKLDLAHLNLAETSRHNQASEAAERSKIGLGYAQLSETSRHNQQAEALQGYDLNIRQQQQDENVRHNYQTEEVARQKTAAEKDLSIAKTEFQNLQNKWYEIQQEQSYDLNQRKIEEVENNIRQIQAAINQADRRLDQGDVSNWIQSINAVNRLVRSTDSIVGGLSQ